jgi:hypothetical protein
VYLKNSLNQLVSERCWQLKISYEEILIGSFEQTMDVVHKGSLRYHAWQGHIVNAPMNVMSNTFTDVLELT